MWRVYHILKQIKYTLKTIRNCNESKSVLIFQRIEELPFYHICSCPSYQSRQRRNNRQHERADLFSTRWNVFTKIMRCVRGAKWGFVEHDTSPKEASWPFRATLICVVVLFAKKHIKGCVVKTGTKHNMFRKKMKTHTTVLTNNQIDTDLLKHFILIKKDLLFCELYE